jgi:phosphoribosylaminoimidazole-succinocarboxamide synthase
VEYRAIDAVDCKKHPSSKPWLNHAYRIDHPQDVSALAARDEQVIDTIKQLASVNDIELSDAKIEAALSAAGWDYDGN